MPINILMPALSPTMTEGTLARWLKKEGDSVKSGQVIAEIETDKATMEVEAVDEGKIVKLLIAAGTSGVAVNTPIAVLLEDGEASGATVAVPEMKPAPTTAAPAAAPAPAVAPSVVPLAAQQNGERVFASPLAKRVAEQSGMDLARVAGSGPNGRIIKSDVEKAQAGGGAPVAAPKAAPVAAAPTAAKPSVTPAPVAPKPPAGSGNLPAGVDARDLADKLGQAYEAIPNSGVRKVIAKRLMESKLTVPHFYLTVDCVIDDLLELRKKTNTVEGVKISVNDFIIRAVALSLRKVPTANAAWTDEAILQFKAVDVSVAVATPNGLITPIVKQADVKTVAQISKEMKDLAQRAKDGKLRPEEFMGGGFSISNLGMFGVKDFAAIINPPQACILAVGAGEQRAVVKDGQLAVATVMSCTLSVDHRAVDGAVGAEFLQAFKALVEQPYGLVV
ncbi:MAG: pyruvate dehydrogenase complex dihydrolipoamide acetyltransferase [Alphaproteobacteria bacterium]|nr:pyruvate dehydrogenase complex dihydrolipoamide acetyltransferase [Alphaproteobacteria bacterium]